MKAIGKNIDGKEIEISFNTAFSCNNNQLTELNLPNDVQRVYCFNNPIKEITLPKSIIYAELPLNCIVTNLDDFKNNNEVEIYFI